MEHVEGNSIVHLNVSLHVSMAEQERGVNFDTFVGPISS